MTTIADCYKPLNSPQNLHTLSSYDVSWERRKSGGVAASSAIFLKNDRGYILSGRPRTDEIIFILKWTGGSNCYDCRAVNSMERQQPRHKSHKMTGKCVSKFTIIKMFRGRLPARPQLGREPHGTPHSVGESPNPDTPGKSHPGPWSPVDSPRHPYNTWKRTPQESLGAAWHAGILPLTTIA